MFQLDPLTRKKLRRFRSIRRGYWSFVIILILVALSCLSELFVNNRALLVRHNGQLYFPTYGNMIPGTQFGLDYDYETNYRELKQRLTADGNFVVLPLIPYNAFENDLESSPPSAPDFARQHFLGTDAAGRDVAARLVYGFRIAIAFAAVLVFIEYLVGISIGCAMGYFGGKFDLIVQRLIEIWQNIPFLYIVMIVAAIFPPSFFTLIVILIAFGWMARTTYMRTLTYKEKASEYVLAAKAVGMTTPRILFKEILPNTVALIVTLVPFSTAAAITSLSVLDYLGFGLPPPTPSWGELLRQGTQHLTNAPWIALSVICALALLLTMITFIGEAVAEAFNPKKHTTYE